MTVLKHEWRKREKQIYLPKTKPVIINVPVLKFLTISGEGNPNTQPFADCVSALYALSYGIKMTLKKANQGIKDYKDYTVYPLEGVYDINVEAKKNFNGDVNKDDLVYTLMIRQPEFVTEVFFNKIAESMGVKKPHLPIDNVRLESLEEGTCVQMLHIGSFDDEPESFKIMEEFAQEHQKIRLSKMHREIYLNDFRKVRAEKLRTVLRFQIDG